MKPDSDPDSTIFAELEAGSQQTRNARHAQMLGVQSEPLRSWAAFLFFVVLALAGLGTVVLIWALGGAI